MDRGAIVAAVGMDGAVGLDRAMAIGAAVAMVVTVTTGGAMVMGGATTTIVAVAMDGAIVMSGTGAIGVVVAIVAAMANSPDVIRHQTIWIQAKVVNRSDRQSQMEEATQSGSLSID